MKIFLYSLLAAFLGLLGSTSAQACAACYNVNAGSKMGHAANVGIIAMVIIMFGMLGAIGMFIAHLNYRSKHPLPDYNELLSEDAPPVPPTPQS